ncbi:MAG: adenosylmethionine decarboxylase [Gammaproteobacteria bacterium]|nr:adenosylmethionine decarboxylase [Gammaproteobacteria bacterium]MBU1623608.1 adenosylmethionine decarboxylase [Gammaproteobacteria bacterium]
MQGSSSNQTNTINGTEGLHLIGDLYDCKTGETLMVDAEALKSSCVELCTDAGLQVVGENFFQFDDAGVTGCVLLAESHVAVHTWPEHGNVTIDVYVCNYNMDNSAKAQKVFDGILELFSPENPRIKPVQRGQI